MPQIPNIDVSLYPGLRSSANPRVSTRAGLVGGARPGGGNGGGEPDPTVTLIFSENFNDQPDWTSGLSENDLGGIPGVGLPDRTQSVSAGHTLPENWDYVYQNPTLAESIGDEGKREVIEILAEHSSKSFGGSGKCFLQQRVSMSDNSQWTSDGQLLKLLGDGYDELYIEFYIAFDPDWTWEDVTTDASKIFRVGSWSGNEPIFEAFPGGNQGPLFVYDWQTNAFGLRNNQTCRGGPHGENYYLTTEQTGSWPRGSMNWTTDTVGMGVGGSTPQIVDKLNGGFISDNMGQTVEHPQIFGPGGTYTKMAFYVRMNSAPGADDGGLMQWLDGVQILNVQDLMWVPSLPEGVTEMPKWNFFSIGGNDQFKVYPISEGVQEWWSMDFISVYDGIPENL